MKREVSWDYFQKNAKIEKTIKEEIDHPLKYKISLDKKEYEIEICNDHDQKHSNVIVCNQISVPNLYSSYPDQVVDWILENRPEKIIKKYHTPNFSKLFSDLISHGSHYENEKENLSIFVKNIKNLNKRSICKINKDIEILEKINQGEKYGNNSANIILSRLVAKKLTNQINLYDFNHNFPQEEQRTVNFWIKVYKDQVKRIIYKPWWKNLSNKINYFFNLLLKVSVGALIKFFVSFIIGVIATLVIQNYSPAKNSLQKICQMDIVKNKINKE